MSFGQVPFGLNGIGTQVAYAAGNTYYVSPTGNDSNPGTVASPWKTIQIQKAAATLQAGDTAIFKDCVYDSNQTIKVTNNGSEGAPITIKARNKQKAKLLFYGLNTTSKIILQTKEYIEIQDFEITQQTSGTAIADVLRWEEAIRLRPERL